MELNYKDWVNKFVTKKSGKIFKTGMKIIQVKALVVNPDSGNAAFKLSDDTLIDCAQCNLAENKSSKISVK